MKTKELIQLREEKPNLYRSYILKELETEIRQHIPHHELIEKCPECSSLLSIIDACARYYWYA